MTPVPVSASTVSPLLGHHPLQGVVVQPHAPARTPVDQAGGGATHRTGVGDGLRGPKERAEAERERGGRQIRKERGCDKVSRKWWGERERNRGEKK